jgi:hypothetical protein
MAFPLARPHVVAGQLGPDPGRLDRHSSVP